MFRTAILGFVFLAGFALSACTTAPAEKPAPSGNVFQDYVQSAQRAIAQNIQTVPVSNAQAAGALIVALTIDRDGRLIDSALEKSTGLAALDTDLLAAVQRAAPFGKLPDELPGETMSMKLLFCLDADPASCAAPRP